MSDPIAYFLTFTTYGSRLAGDERGSVDRNHNRFETPTIAPVGTYEGYARSLQTSGSLVFTSQQRLAVDRAIRERCLHAGWEIYALNVRTNHVHVVLGADTKPELAMNSLKVWATRALRRARLVDPDQKIWTRHGSTRYVWDERGLESVCLYTLEMQ
ncbi:MAG: transposase [Dehalococcoidia bacterium]